MVQEVFGPEITERAFNENVQHIISDPFNAVIEIISNSWDSGAENVLITWPEERGEEVVIEDDGEGMTKEEFREIWPKISYNRLKFKGKEVEFRRKREGYREAYGCHGKGRHAPFCFAGSYTVETWKDGESSKFEIKRDKSNGFRIKELKVAPKEDSGTKLFFKLNENYRRPEEVKKEIGARFLTDPSFKIVVNGTNVKLTDLGSDYLEKIDCKIDEETVEILKIKAGTRSRNTHFHGVTWIIGRRRIKNTAWEMILDGRISKAKQYSYVVYADILKNELNETMSDFKKTDRSKEIQDKIISCIKKSVAHILAHERDEVKKSILTDHMVSLKEMSSVDQDEIGMFISGLQEARTTIHPADLKAATGVFINIKKSKSGLKFIHQLSKLNPEEIDNLSEMMDDWSVKEAKVVLDLIHSRLKLIEELEIKTNNPQTLELEELQPLFEKGLWIFGPEYESIEFTSNQSLTTVAISLLNKKGFKAKESRLRPDFVVLPDSTLSIHSCDKFNEDNESDDIDKILFIELKRGGHTISLTERTQVENYIDILIREGAISEGTRIDAYILGSTVVCNKVEAGELKNIHLIPMQYHRVLKKAERRLLNLRKKIEEVKKIKDEPTDPAIKETLAQTTLEEHN